MLEMTFFIKRYTLDRVWTGLNDDEFMWEPAPSTWSVRPVSESRTATPFVSGAYEADYDSTQTMGVDWARDGEPLTNIAWLFWHIGSVPGRAAELDFLGGAHTTESGWTSPYLGHPHHPIFTSADEAVATMRDGWRALVGALRSATDEQLERPTRSYGYGGEGPMSTGSQILASLLNEISHHGAQITVLRDLYRSRHVL